METSCVEPQKYFTRAYPRKKDVLLFMLEKLTGFKNRTSRRNKTEALSQSSDDQTLAAIPSNKGIRPTSIALQRDIDIYIDRSRQLAEDETIEDPSSFAIGASSLEEFYWSGKMEADVLFQFGLNDDSTLMDVGCGSGRLASALVDRFSGTYLGTDISAELLETTRSRVARSGFSFQQVDGIFLPTEDMSLDMVCFFSVLTHLRHEECFLYLKDTFRALRPGGRVVLSFLEFGVASHWLAFESVIADLEASVPYVVNQYIEPVALKSWAERIGFQIIAMHEGDKPHIRNSHPRLVHIDSEMVSLGQSICVLERPK